MVHWKKPHLERSPVYQVDLSESLGFCIMNKERGKNKNKKKESIVSFLTL